MEYHQKQLSYVLQILESIALSGTLVQHHSFIQAAKATSSNLHIFLNLWVKGVIVMLVKDISIMIEIFHHRKGGLFKTL